MTCQDLFTERKGENKTATTAATTTTTTAPLVRSKDEKAHLENDSAYF